MQALGLDQQIEKSPRGEYFSAEFVDRETSVDEISVVVTNGLDANKDEPSIEDVYIQDFGLHPVIVKIEPDVEASVNARALAEWKRYRIIVDMVEAIELSSSIDLLPVTELTGCLTYVNVEHGTLSPLGDLPRKLLSKKVTYGSVETLPPYDVD